MSTTTELPPIISGEEALETLPSPRESLKSGQNVEANKSPTPSMKSSPNLDENVEEKIRSSVKSGQDVENAQAEKSSPSPSVSPSGQVKKSPRSSDVDVPSEPEGEKPPTEEHREELEETKTEVNESPQVPQPTEPPEIPQSPEKPGGKRVSFSDETKPAEQGATEQRFSGGFISNKGVKQPSMKETLMTDTDSGDIQIGASNRPAESPARPPWLGVAVSLVVLTILMRFFMSTFRFVAVVVYATLVAMLVLRYVGHGPLAQQRRS